MLPGGFKKGYSFVWIFALYDYAHGKRFFIGPSVELGAAMENTVGGRFAGDVMQQLFVISTREPNRHFHCRETLPPKLIFLHALEWWLDRLRARKQGSIHGNVMQRILFDAESSCCIDGPNTCFKLSPFFVEFPHLTYKPRLYFRISKRSHFWPPLEKHQRAQQTSQFKVDRFLPNNTEIYRQGFNSTAKNEQSNISERIKRQEWQIRRRILPLDGSCFNPFEAPTC
jgi:hypothetical protein